MTYTAEPAWGDNDVDFSCHIVCDVLATHESTNTNKQSADKRRVAE